MDAWKTAKGTFLGQQGKTMMELMVVTALVGMVAAMAVPNFFMLQSRMDVYSLTQEIAAELRLARQLAMTERDRMRVVFDLDQQVIVAQRVNGRASVWGQGN
jgi:type IV fimbrial biogenesis protein FimT